MKRIISFILTMTLVFALCACNGEQKPQVSLSNSSVTVLSDTTGTITLNSESASGIVWKSSDNSVVTVKPSEEDSRYAHITALDTGTAIIEVTQGNTVLRCSVKVIELALERADGNEMTLDLKDGYASQNISVFTNIPDGKALSYYSDNLLVAYAMNDGTIVATGVGETTVNAVHPSGITYTVKVKVINSAQQA